MNSWTCRLLATCAAAIVSVVAAPSDAQEALRPRAEFWLVGSAAELDVPPLTATASEIEEVRIAVGRRSAVEIERARWWDVGGPAYRWNEVAIDEMLRAFMLVQLASRNLALLHAAIDDAVAASWIAKREVKRPRPSQVDPTIETVVPVPSSSSYPSDHAAAAAAAALVLTYVFPQRGNAFASRGEEAMRSRVLAGVEFPSDVEAGRAIGRKAAALAIERGRADGSNRQWTGTVPTGAGKWQGTNPLSPLAGEWRPWVLRDRKSTRLNSSHLGISYA